jgi:putative SOS response-associated peptidase YedK
MIVTNANAFVGDIHDRMPALLTEGQFEPWLKAEAGIDCLSPVSNEYLQKWPVSKRVNSSKADTDDPILIEEVELAA